LISQFITPLNWDIKSEPRTISGRLFQSFGAKCENALPPLVDLDILGMTSSLEFSDLKECDGLWGDRRSIKYTGAKPFRAL